ncbi:hypothetical protein Bca52824_062273 [Brassica carinata]|uniref:Protein PHLOEM PROTEIN 2-LIKE A10 n=1 Tax=Brassica carinata TaxID=52824 RepID=A0A8X7QDX2_BRACI|nr:hypothetical protein Bca52824_062273 [Brassica carinata]
MGEKSLFSPRRRRKWLIFISISGLSGYALHKFYHSPSIARKRKRLAKFLTAIVSVTESISDSAETISLVSRDLKTFLDSDSDHIPNTLKQISKIVNSNEFTDSLSNVSQALTIGVSRGYNNLESGPDPGTSVVDKVIDKAFSEAGSGFLSVLVGSFAKNLVLGFYGDSDSSAWVNLLCDDKCRELLSDCIQRFTSTAVSVYLDKTMEINAYDQIFQGLTNPKHQDSVKEVLVSVCNGALQTLVKTSHEVFTSSSRSSTVIEEEDEFKSNGWTNAISVPSNRRFMFDVTGRVTLETAKSVIEFVMMKTLQVFRKSFEVVQEEVTERGRQVVRYVGAKSSVIVTLCLALYLHIISTCVRNSPIGVSHHF